MSQYNYLTEIVIIRNGLNTEV